jgi:hypothetical protein
LARRVSAGLLEHWNRGYRLADGLQDPPALLARWLGHRLDPTQGRIRGFLADQCGLSAADPCLIFEGQWQPNPLAFADGVLPLPERLRARAATGQVHGDLNGWNVLSVVRPGAARASYYLIDLALYEDDQYLFYDHAYLELAHLLHACETVDAAHWQSILDQLMRFRAAPEGGGERAEDVGLLKIVSVVRREVLNWIDRHEPHRLAQLESQ